MSNSQVLVAGTGGITLMDNSGSDLGYPVKMRLGVLSAKLAKLPPPELTELLSMEHRPGQIAPAAGARMVARVQVSRPRIEKERRFVHVAQHSGGQLIGGVSLELRPHRK